MSGAVFRLSEAADGCQLIECDGIGAVARSGAATEADE